MFNTQTQATSKQRIPMAEVLISLGLFLLALLPRAYDLQRFVTADEAKWVYRSAQFLAALLNGDFAATNVNLTPAVTTTWLGSLGLTIYYYLHQAAIDLSFNDWLLAQPGFRVEVPVLVAVRWPMVIFTASSVVIIYWLARRLFNRWLAFLGAIFIALDAHTVALSRILGHDAPATIFMFMSLLLLLLAVKNVTKDAAIPGLAESPPSIPPFGGEVNRFSPLWGELEGGNQFTSQIIAKQAIRQHTFCLILSGVAAGLAFLSKSPAFFLIPFTLLVMLALLTFNPNISLLQGIKWMAVWGLAAYLAFVVFWPAAWVDPIGQLWAVVQNAFLSATDHVEAEAEGYWLVPNLGPFYYLVNGAFKLSPLVTIGTVLAVIFSIISYRQNNDIAKASTRNTQHAIRITQNFVHNLGRSPLFWFTLFTLLFTIFMTLGGKRSSRYILPIFPALAFVAAYGWIQLLSAVPKLYALRIVFIALLTIISIFTLLPYAPYYFTYYNPLLGGAYTAPSLVKIGWGEGLDQVGRFLQRELPHSRVGTAYASTVAAYFKGDISAVTGDRLDYVVLYSKQVQSGEPSPGFIRYFEQSGNPIFSVELDGIHYADIYPGPAPQPITTVVEESNHQMPHPISYRPYSPYGNIGQPLEIDIIWDAADPLPAKPVTVALAPLNSIEDGLSDSVRFDEDMPVLAAAEVALTRPAQELVVSHHRLILPEELERGTYAILLEGQLVGEIELRHFELPSRMGGVRHVVFDEQIGIVGYTFQPTEDYISVTIAWQAEKSGLPDYTVFAQYIDVATGERVAGIDTQPVKGQWPTSRWVKGEIVVDEYLVAMPPGLKPGFYGMMVGLYHPDTGQRLVRANGQDFWPLPFTFIHK